LNPADNGLDLYNGIKQWIDRYHNRDHQGIERKKPKNTYQNAA
jgi:putative transposase